MDKTIAEQNEVLSMSDIKDWSVRCVADEAHKRWEVNLEPMNDMEAEIYKLQARVKELEIAKNLAIGDRVQMHAELDRMGAPSHQDNGYPYNPIGRLRKLTTQVIGEVQHAKMLSLVQNENRLKAHIAELEAAQRWIPETEELFEELLDEFISEKGWMDHWEKSDHQLRCIAQKLYPNRYIKCHNCKDIISKSDICNGLCDSCKKPISRPSNVIKV